MLGALLHRFAIRRRRLNRDLLCFCRTESTPARGENETRGEALQVPFERCWRGLIEIVDIEDDVSFGGCETAEIDQMAVPAGMNDYSARGCGSEVVGLDEGGPSEIRKRRLEHPAMSNRNQILQPAFIGAFD